MQGERCGLGGLGNSLLGKDVPIKRDESECVMAHRIQIVDCHERFGGEARPNAGGPGFGWHAECFGGHLLVVGWFWGLPIRNWA